MQRLPGGLKLLQTIIPPSSAPSGHLLPQGEGTIRVFPLHEDPKGLKERVAEGRVRGEGRGSRKCDYSSRLLTDLA